MGTVGAKALGPGGKGQKGDLYLPGEGRGSGGSEEAPRTGHPPIPGMAAKPTSMKLAESHGLLPKLGKGGKGRAGALWPHPSPGRL